MKKITLLLLLVLLSFPIMAQEDTADSTQMETLISGKIESGGYGALFGKIGPINGETGIFIGGQGGWIINHRIVLGGKGYGIVNNVEVKDSENLKLEFGCGGLLVEYIMASNKLIHFNVNSMIGAGSIKYAVKDYQQNNPEFDYSSDGFFILEPGFNMVLNVGEKFRIGAGVSYRYIDGLNYDNLTNSDISGLAAELIFKFGKF